jgi:hypothetical protein
MIVIKGNKFLFEEWHKLAIQVSGLAGIVQNDIEITNEDYEEWIKLAIKHSNKITELTNKTIQYVEKGE